MRLLFDEWHLLNIGIAPPIQQQGWGRRLLRDLMARARRIRPARILLEVRRSNQPARSLYLSEKFIEIGRRKDYYPAKQGREDAVVMARKI